ncbi:MAG: tetratricopeptide repeat protein [Pseudomonadota bacterium]
MTGQRKYPPRPAGLIAAAAFLLLMGAACGPKKDTAHPVDPTKPIDRVVMEPVVIAAFDENGELKFEHYDAESLFDEGLKFIDADRPEIAVKYFEKILKEFKDTKLLSAALFNAGYAYEKISQKENKKENLKRAAALYDELASSIPDSPDVVDALFRKGYCLESLGKSDEAIAVYNGLLERDDLSSQDKLEARTRIGKLLIGKSEFAKAEDVLRENIMFFIEVSVEERIENNYYAAQAQFEIAEIYRTKFEEVTFSTQESKIRKEFEVKLELMMKAKDAFVETIKIGNYHWAAVSGYKVGMLMKTLYDQVMGAPLPPSINTKELKEIYFEMLDKKVSPLLESAVNVWEKTLLMSERVGYSGEWVEKLEEAMDETAKLLKQ